MLDPNPARHGNLSHIIYVRKEPNPSRTSDISLLYRTSAVSLVPIGKVEAKLLENHKGDAMNIFYGEAVDEILRSFLSRPPSPMCHTVMILFESVKEHKYHTATLSIRRMDHSCPDERSDWNAQAGVDESLAEGGNWKEMIMRRSVISDIDKRKGKDGIPTMTLREWDRWCSRVSRFGSPADVEN